MVTVIKKLAREKSGNFENKIFRPPWIWISNPGFNKSWPLAFQVKDLNFEFRNLIFVLGPLTYDLWNLISDMWSRIYDLLSWTIKTWPLRYIEPVPFNVSSLTFHLWLLISQLSPLTFDISPSVFQVQNLQLNLFTKLLSAVYQ